MKLVTDTDVRKKLAELEAQDIYDMSEWEVRQRVLDRRANGKALNGIKLPWAKTHDRIRLRPGEVSIWAGYNGHFKSTLLTQVAAWAAQTVPVGIGSFEMELEDTFNLIADQCAGTPDVEPKWLNDFCTWSEKKIYLYDRLDSIPPMQMLSGIDHMADELGCGLIIIDSLMMVRGVVDDMEQERNFMQLLTGVAKHYQTHIALVHHMRKPERGDETHIPGKYDLRGSGAISDLAHSVFLCWNNKAKRQLECKVDDDLPLTPEEARKWDKEKDRPDQLLITAKQRHGAFEGATGLWQHRSRQFTATSRREATPLEIPRLAA